MNLPGLIKRNKLLAGLAFALLAFCTAPAAQAQDSCAPHNQDSDIYIEVTGDCTISGDLISTNGIVYLITHGGTATVTGQISATGGDVYVYGDNGVSVGSSVYADYGVDIESTGGSITIGGTIESASSDGYFHGSSDVIASSTITIDSGQLNVISDTGKIQVVGNTSSQNGALFWANNDVSLAGVENTVANDVRIFASMGGGGSDPFEIGGSGAASGVQYVHDNTSFGSWSVYITNGNSAGITYSGDQTLQSNGSDTFSGTIVLDGGTQNNVTLSGTISVDGASGQTSGVISIFAPEIIANGATLTTNSPGQQVGGIGLYTNAITTNSGLTLSNNGNGFYPSYVDLSITPVGSYSVSAPTDLSEYISYGSYTGSSNPVAITGAGAFNINAIGNNNGVKIWGYPLTISAATTTINQQGSNDIITMDSWDGGSNIGAVTLGGTIAVHINTNAAGQTAGSMRISGNSLSPNPLTGNVLLDASGTDGGDGGTIYLLPGSGEADFAGSGNYFTLNANGSSSGGNGGSINVWGGSGTFNTKIENVSGVTASAQSGDSNGGSITINSGDLDFVQSNATLSADATGTGNGGIINLSSSSMEFTGTTSSISTNGAGTTADGAATNGITIFTYSDLVIGSGSTGDVSLSANALAASSTGGNINISASNITADGAKITVTAGTSGDGGTISLTGDPDSGTVEISGTLDASSGTDGGDGGAITLSSQTLELDADSIISANGLGTDSNGGTISVSNLGETAFDLTQTQIEAQGDSSGDGAGGIIAYIAPVLDVFDLYDQIKLFPGVDATANQKYGDVSHGGVTCKSYTTGETSWPVYYNDCTGNTPTETVSTFAISLSSGLRGALTGGTYGGVTVTTHLFTFNNISDMDPILQLHAAGIPAPSIDADGATMQITSPGNVYVGIAEGAFSNVTVEKEVIAHELGHAIDRQLGMANSGARPSTSATYNLFAMNDWITMDYSTIGLTKASSTPRDPCAGAGAPLAGVWDQSHSSYYCTMGVLTNSAYNGKTTTQILALSSDYAGIFAPLTDPITHAFIGWTELYAQAFAYSDYANGNVGTIANLANPTADTLFQAGSLACVKSWSDAVVSGGFTPPSTPSYCSDLTPAWYQPFN